MQTHHQLFGPTHSAGSINKIHGTTYVFPGEVLSCSNKIFRFGKLARCKDMPYAIEAIWILIWQPANTNHKARLIHADQGPSNITEICEITPVVTGGAIASSFDFTGPFNDLLANGIDKRIGWQVKDDGIAGSVFYESRLEILWS